MITTVTLNVAIDKSYVIDVLKKGEVMRVHECTKTPGGKGLNVARVIKLCGEDVLATGIVGGHSGAYVEDLLKKQDIAYDFVHTASETRTCINVLDSEGNSTEFLEPGDPVSQTELNDLLVKFADMITESDVITISGSVPKGVNIDIYARLVAMVKEKGKQVILDTSGDLLKEGIKACPTMIKPNRDEVKALLNMSVDNWDELVAGARKLQSNGIKYVVVSLGTEGALVVTKDHIYHGKPPCIQPVNTVGSGDSMVAAFAVGLARKYQVEEMLRYAIAVSAANTLTMTTGNFKEEDMKVLYDQVTITHL
ncbi:1-phosphofructokinase [Metabacillus sediminilitoris]|uniref:Tagatose-6-phosphate kinase n=1 Tax=Metabacillus sediminilitoris TaxID=2567941 RepID=A0A4S4C0M8_9BACI|nr:1-phosphofructokinase [Metabacillus sediminilitoris]QGQ47786.1 1-phosphofructokinase [Metabacillus sediminilitoris]THF81101.1 1-phosphofructokinase [Metabacillus sediminilitoris]